AHGLHPMCLASPAALGSSKSRVRREVGRTHAIRCGRSDTPMKIASVIGICAIAGATALGCSGSNSSGGGFTGEDISDDGGGNPASSSGVTSSSGASSNGGAGGTSGGSSGGTASSSGATASSGGQPSDAGGVKITTGDAAVGADPETDYTQTKTVTMDSFNVPANSEVFYCQ